MHLEDLLLKTLAIEKAQMEELNIDSLNKFLDDITMIKMQAIEELTHADLRDDRLFTTFLTQCANLIHKIQFKINTYSQKSGLN